MREYKVLYNQDAKERGFNFKLANENNLDVWKIYIQSSDFDGNPNIQNQMKEYKISEDAANQLHLLLFTAFGDNLLGPANPYVSRIRNYYIKEFLVKIDRNDSRLASLKKFIKQQIAKLYENKLYSQLIVQIDVDAL
jgi:hypothetical protein